MDNSNEKANQYKALSAGQNAKQLSLEDGENKKKKKASGNKKQKETLAERLARQQIKYNELNKQARHEGRVFLSTATREQKDLLVDLFDARDALEKTKAEVDKKDKELDQKDEKIAELEARLAEFEKGQNQK